LWRCDKKFAVLCDELDASSIRKSTMAGVTSPKTCAGTCIIAVSCCREPDPPKGSKHINDNDRFYYTNFCLGGFALSPLLHRLCVKPLSTAARCCPSLRKPSLVRSRRSSGDRYLIIVLTHSLRLSFVDVGPTLACLARASFQGKRARLRLLAVKGLHQLR
jgi:hypothetical protein